MRFAYADPPYIGCAKRYEGGTEVNHRILIGYLEDAFDGWALSCSSPSLRVLLPLCPEKARVMAWVKPYVPHRPGVGPTYAWEPVITKPLPRKHSRNVDTSFDWVSCLPGGHARRGIGKQRILGEKPIMFVHWLLRACRVHRDDEIEDVFPGSGAVAEAIDQWRRQGVLALDATPPAPASADRGDP